MSAYILNLAITQRPNKGLTLQQIAADTNISVRCLEAIEAGNFNKLPGGIYATSYIRQYSRAVDVDEFDLLALYHGKTGAPQVTPQIEKVENPSLRTFRPLFQQ